MSILKLAKYSDDDLRLVDVGDAEFLRRKLQPDVHLDFAGVEYVSALFLDTLLAGQTPESIADRILNCHDAIDRAVAAWVDRVSAPVQPRERAVQITRPKSVPPTPERDPIIDDRFTPTRLVERLRMSLRGYIESAYPLSDPILIKARRQLLESEAGGHLLSQEPFIETTTRYAASTHTYEQLGLPTHIGELFARLARTRSQSSGPDDDRRILYPSMYEHQRLAFEAFLVAGRDIVVATGTGSGKTECFLVPMLGSLYDEAHERPESFELPAVRALILYPMNALVNDQLARLRLLFGDRTVTREFAQLPSQRFPQFGMYTGRTPYPGPRKSSKDRERVAPLLEYYLNMDAALEQRLRELGRYPAKDIHAFFAKHEEQRAIYEGGKRRGKQYLKHHWEHRLHTAANDCELLTRHEMVHGVGTRPGRSPDILVTNYSMLEYMLMRPFERPIFSETRRWLERDDAKLLLVLDEAHMYRGAKGAEVAFLLRRLRARLGIHDRPDKLRVIATSASLGSDAATWDNIRRFAADLAGKTPSDFVAIGGKRESASPAAPATPAEAELFASVKLEALGLAGSDPAGSDLRTCLLPVFEFYQVATSIDDDDATLLRALYRALFNRPLVNLLLSEAARQAQALGELAQRVFPNYPRQRQALQALLALGALARSEPEAPGLIPTRVHCMFRGLHGLYACLNPRCSGRQSDPGEQAIVGKLFSFPRASCDACGSRVFELASCRSCGTPYLLAYAESGTLDHLEFLWGETKGNLVRFQLLPLGSRAPRYPEHTEELRVHLKTGYLDRTAQHADTDVRSLYIWLDTDNHRETEFARCAMCQPSAPSRSHIHDFRTRGEQPFTALIEAQFAEQPPQKLDPRLPNHGRKVLVFSDGRQKAARLAPALEHSHARDLFRQVIALAADALERENQSTGMIWLYPAIIWLCAERCIDLFPFPEQTIREPDAESKAVVEFRDQIRRARGKTLQEIIEQASRGRLKPVSLFAKYLFQELTDRYYSIQSLAIGVIEEDPDVAQVLRSFPVALPADEVKVLFRCWLRQQLERRSFYPDGASLTELGEGWHSPRGIDASNDGDLLPGAFSDFVKAVVGDDTDVARIKEWLREDVVRGSDLLTFEGDLYYLAPLGLRLRIRLTRDAWLRCIDCGRIHPESLASICPGCCGALVDADPAYLDARTGFYRKQVLRAFDSASLEPFGLSAAEHSAQLTGSPDESAFNKVEEYELRFQDITLDGKPSIDVLSCTTTMEVGIDIGALSGVALRNVPPHVANYQQRAGRAGRRGRSIASVVTYAHGTSHDSHFFENPAAIISGDVRAPIVYVENQQVLERHINAYLVQRFFHEMVPPDPGSRAYALFESLGTVEQFLSDVHLCSFAQLVTWLKANETMLQHELQHWVPTFSYGLDEPIPKVDETIATAISRLEQTLRDVLPIEEFARREQLEDFEREALERRLEDELLQTLIGRAVFPRYAFPTDVVSFWVAKPRKPGEQSSRRTFDYEPQRDLQLALTEYAPGRSLTIDKWRFKSAALFSPYEPTPGPSLAHRQPYTACRDCGFVSLDPAAAAMAVCPCCSSDQLVHTEFITPAGFAPDVNAKRDVDRGQAISYAGITDRARLEVQDPPEAWDRESCAGRLRSWTGSRMLAVVNKGVDERGFRVCPECGRSEPEYGPRYTRTTLTKAGNPASHKHPLERGRVCDGVARGPFYLGHRFPTDALLLRLKVHSPLRLGTANTQGLLNRASRMALTSLVEAIALAASRELQIDEGELSGWWAPVLGGRTDEAQLYLYDLLPGGAGYARAVGDALDSVLDATEALLTGCDCTSSCYRCIRHYGNNYIHASLDRHLALALLRHVRTGAVPTVDAADKQRCLTGLREYLGLRGIEFAEGTYVTGVTVPLQVATRTRTLWIDVHHPLVEPSLASLAVAAAARAKFLEHVELDAFALVHDLPEAVRRLELLDGVAP
jgi:ATP-dependent helicase YprA (DUF1998 family)